MADMKLRLILSAALIAALPLCAADKKPLKAGKWVKMFDGKSIEKSGWKASQNPEAWTVENKTLKGSGVVSHLFWMVEECEDCEFKAEVKIGDGANSGMYFRTAFGPGFPKGYEAQVNATHRDPVKTGSLYSFHKNLACPHKPDEWFTQHIIVQGNHIVIKVNDKVITDITEEKNTFKKGYIALQQHDPKSVVWYRNLMFKKLAK
jgi:hypothetical protein